MGGADPRALLRRRRRGRPGPQRVARHRRRRGVEPARRQPRRARRRHRGRPGRPRPGRPRCSSRSGDAHRVFRDGARRSARLDSSRLRRAARGRRSTTSRTSSASRARPWRPREGDRAAAGLPRRPTARATTCWSSRTTPRSAPPVGCPAPGPSCTPTNGKRRDPPPGHRHRVRLPRRPRCSRSRPARSQVYSDLLGTSSSSTPTSPPTSRARPQLMGAHWEEDYPEHARRRHHAGPGRALLPARRHRSGAGRHAPRLTEDNAVQALLNEPYLELGHRGAGRVLRRGGAGDLRRRHPRPALAGRVLRAWSRPRTRTASASRRSDQRRRDPGRQRGPGRGARRRRPQPARAGHPQRRHRRQDVVLPALPDRGRARGCQDGRQALVGVDDLNQTITQTEAAEAARLGERRRPVRRRAGQQWVFVRIYGPTGGTVDDIKIDGDKIGRRARRPRRPLRGHRDPARRPRRRGDHLADDHRARPDRGRHRRRHARRRPRREDVSFASSC